MQDRHEGTQLPADADAERATLGSLLQNRDAIVAVDGWLKPEHFYTQRHAWVYEAIQAVYRNRTPPDLMTVMAELRRLERLEKVGGMLYLVELSGAVPTAVHIEYYARTVFRTAVFRRLVAAGGKIAALGFDQTQELEAALQEADAELRAVSEGHADRDFVPISEVADSYFAKLNYMNEHRGEMTGVPTGYTDLDEVTGGLQKSDLIILAARPSVGKTSLAMCLAYNIAQMQRKVGVFSLEMSKEQLHERLLAMHTKIDTQRLRSGDVRDTDLDNVMSALGHIGQLPIFIDDTGGLSLSALRAKARRLHAEVGLDLLVIDYLQLMSGGKSENRVQEVSEISRGLKALGRELNIPILALSQLSRAVEGRATHVPMLSDLRESGSIEQDADIVMFIYREELYDKETDKKGIAEIHIAKHRNGPTAVIPMRFDANTTQFQNLDRYRSPEGY